MDGSRLHLDIGWKLVVNIGDQVRFIDNRTDKVFTVRALCGDTITISTDGFDLQWRAKAFRKDLVKI